MAKKKKDDFELDDWDDDFFNGTGDDFPDFDVEPGKSSKDRNPITSVTLGAISGARSAALNPETLKKSLKTALPKEYGSVFELADTVGRLGQDVYGDVFKELKPLVQESKKVLKRAKTAFGGSLPQSISDKLDKLLESEESRKDVDKQEMMELSIQSTLGDIFRTQAEAQDAINKEQAEKDQLKVAVDMKYQKDSLVGLSGISAQLKRLTSYQDTITINWQRKTLELQLRQYHLQREAFDLQKESAAIMQTNLEGILKNTGLPDIVKQTKMEGLLEQSRNRLFNSMLNGVANSSPMNFIKGVGANLRTVAKQRIIGTKDKFQELLAQADQILDANETASEMGIDKTQMIAEMLGGGAMSMAAAKAAVKAREFTERNQKLVNFGRNTQYAINNLPATMRRNAKEGKGEKVGGIGGLFGMLNEAVNMTTNPAAMIKQYNEGPIDGAASFDNRTKRSIVDVIPSYLKEILHTNQQMLSAYSPTLQTAGGKTPSKMIWNWEKNELTSEQSIRSELGRALNDQKDRFNVELKMTELINDHISDVNDQAEYDESIIPIRMDEQTKVKLANFMISLHMRDEEIDPGKLQQLEYWSTIKGYTPEEKEAFANFFLGYGRQTGVKKDISGLNKKSIKNWYSNMTDPDGVDRGKTIKMQNAIREALSGVTSSHHAAERFSANYNQSLFKGTGYFNKDGQLNEGKLYGQKGNQFNYLQSTRYQDDGYSSELDVLRTTPYLSKRGHALSDRIAQLDAEINKLQNNPADNGTQLERLNTQRQSALKELKYEAKKAASFGDAGYANGGVIRGKRYLANGGWNDLGRQSSYTGNGSKWDTKQTVVHAGEVVWSQDDINRIGGLGVVETLRKYGKEGINKLKSFGGSVVNETKIATGTSTIEENVAEIVTILRKGIPTVVRGTTNDTEDIPWYLRSFGSVVGDIASVPFKIASGVFNGFKSGITNATGLIGKGAKWAWQKATSIGSKSKASLLNFADENADKFDVWVKGEAKPRLSAILLKAGQYYNDKGEVIRSWKDITGAVYTLQDGTFVKVYDLEEVKSSVIVNYSNGKNMVMSSIVRVKDFIGNRIKDITNDAGLIGRTAYQMAKYVGRVGLNQIYKPVDVYIKDKVEEGPVLLARLMEKGFYVSKNDTSKVIHSPADIDGEVMDKDGNIALTIKDMRAGLVDINNKPLRIGAIEKMFGKVGDVLGAGFNTISGIYKGAKKGVGSLFGGMQNFFGQFFGDGGLIFANSNKLVDKLEAIYEVLDSRLPSQRSSVKGDSDNDGIRNGSSRDLRKRNAIDRAKKAKEREAEKKEALQSAKDRMKLLKDKRANSKGIAGLLGLDKVSDALDSFKDKLSGAGDMLDGLGSLLDGLFGRGKRGAKGTGGKLGGLFGRGAKGAAAAKAGGGLLSRLGSAGKLGVKGVGAGLLLGGAGMAANAAGFETLGSGLDIASDVATYGSMALGAANMLGMGGLVSGATGALAAGSSAVLGGATALGGAALSGLGAAAGFLLTNPVGWAVLAGAAGYGIYKWMSKKKLDKFGKYRYVQYGFPAENDEWHKTIKKVEDFFEEHTAKTDTKAIINDSKVNVPKFFDIFDVSMQNREQCIKILKWYNERFRPVYENAYTALVRINPKLKLSEVEDKLSDSEQLRFLTAAQFPQGPYAMSVSPVPDLPQLPSDANAVKVAYDKLLKEVEKAAGQKADTKSKTELKVETMATATASATVSSVQANQTTENTTTTPKPTIAPVIDSTAATAMSGAVTTITANAVTAKSSTGEVIDALTAVRMKAYGLNDFDAEKYSVLEGMELSMLNYITLNVGKPATLTADLDQLTKEYAPDFGINTSDVTAMTYFRHYLENRFIPVLLNQVSTVAKLTNKSDVLTVLTDTLKPEIQVEVANALISTKTDLGSVWLIDSGLWKGYKLNTDASSVTGHVAAIKKKLKTTERKAEEDSSTVQKQANSAGTLPLSNQEKQKAEREAEQASKQSGGMWDSVKSGLKWMKDKATSALQSVDDTVTGGAIGGTMESIGTGLSAMGEGLVQGVTGKLSGSREEYRAAIWREMAKAGITSKNEVAAFLSQIAVETGNLKWLEELASGAAYNDRKDLGNTQPGDGPRFKGRGLIQLTGRANYEKFAKAVNRPDIMQNPELVSKDPTLAVQSAIYYWNSRKGLREAAQRGDIKRVSKLVNGGYNHLKERTENFNNYLNGNGPLWLADAARASVTDKPLSANNPNIKSPMASKGLMSDAISGAGKGLVPPSVENAAANGGIQTFNEKLPSTTAGGIGQTTPSQGGGYDRSAFANSSGGYAQGDVRNQLPSNNGMDSSAPRSGGVGSIPSGHRINKAISFIQANAQGKSVGRCASYVANALQNAGYKFTRNGSAYMYHTNGTMKAMGFQQIQDNGRYQYGDVIVWGNGPKCPHGHIQMYTPAGWISDFKQRSVVPGSKYATVSRWLYRDATLMGVALPNAANDSNANVPQKATTNATGKQIEQQAKKVSNDSYAKAQELINGFGKPNEPKPEQPDSGAPSKLNTNVSAGQNMSIVPNESVRNAQWEKSQREAGTGTLLDSVRAIQGYDPLNVQNKVLQNDATVQAADTKLRLNILNVLTDSNTEHKQTNKLLTAIANKLDVSTQVTKPIPGKQQPKAEPVDPIATANVDSSNMKAKTVRNPLQKAEQMSNGVLTVRKSAY